MKTATKILICLLAFCFCICICIAASCYRYDDGSDKKHGSVNHFHNIDFLQK